ncbi:MAG: ABC transporter ATP-binding protein [Myxococcaceae bacterium]
MDDASLELRTGERVALVGENGAGKSSLMNVLYGLYQPDAGEIWIDGRQRRLKSPREAIAAGIGMVHQHFMLVPTLTAAENLVLGDEPRQGLLLDRAAARQALLTAAQRLAFTLDPDARVDTMTVGAQQKLEILKALHRGARVLILDEPTAVLTPQETDELFAVTRQLSANGHTVVLISHKLQEILSVAERVVVMRRGKNVAEVAAAQTHPEELSRLMVGDVKTAPATRGTVSDAQVLSVENISSGTLRDVSLMVRSGEIVGIAGIDGNGQRELAEVIVGLREISKGRVVLAEKTITKLNVAERRAEGIAHIPEDRLLRAIVGPMSVEENAALGKQSGRWIDRAARRRQMETLVEEMDVRPRNTNTKMRAADLSGGNQQKLVVGRELSGAPKLVVAGQPTRGLDIAAVETVRARLRKAAEQGAGVLLFSLDLDELRALCHRMYVLREGAIVGEVTQAVFDERAIGRMMLGVQS